MLLQESKREVRFCTSTAKTREGIGKVRGEGGWGGITRLDSDVVIPVLARSAIESGLKFL